VLDLASEAGRPAAAAREGTLGAEEVRGGPLSVTNIGAIGGTFSFPIIHAPQTAILGVHAIKKRPVVLDDDTIAPRSMTYLSLSFDHRLVDGAEAAAFTNRLIELLETPEALLLEG
jgi:pyruvate dehydrogenase E2 component (dihydrolipoamide acetyltransferase)